MIMGLISKQNPEFAILFVATSLLNCITTRADLSTPDTTSISPSSSETSLTSSTSNAAAITANLSNLMNKYLSPELFSESDPLANLLSKLTKNVYHKMIGNSSSYIKVRYEMIRNHVNFFLKARKFPRRYVPYAKLLYSSSCCLARLNNVAIEILRFQMEYPNESEYPKLTSGISSAELRSLFDADIFSDPSIPSVLVQKLVKIPSDKIPDVVKNLKKLSYNHENSVQRAYQYYMHFLEIFFENLDDLESLRNAYLKCQTPK